MFICNRCLNVSSVGSPALTTLTWEIACGQLKPQEDLDSRFLTIPFCWSVPTESWAGISRDHVLPSRISDIAAKQPSGLIPGDTGIAYFCIWEITDDLPAGIDADNVAMVLGAPPKKSQVSMTRRRGGVSYINTRRSGGIPSNNELMMFTLLFQSCQTNVQLGSRSVPRLSAPLACFSAVLGAGSGCVAEIGGWQSWLAAGSWPVRRVDAAPRV